MEFIIKGPFKNNIYNLMRGVGYHFVDKNETTGEINFVNPIRGGDFPRFHIFLTVKNNTLIFNLHLDQKKPIYKGTTAHSGEYDGEVVEKEAERIKEIILNY
jgi:hypothetical protein